MSSIEQFWSVLSPGSEVSVAGVPWPVYKLVALVAGFLVALFVGALTTSTAPAVLSGAATGTVIWLVLRASQHQR
jgi:hypothetical protein